jgi:hypothetical protein
MPIRIHLNDRGAAFRVLSDVEMLLACRRVLAVGDMWRVIGSLRDPLVGTLTVSFPRPGPDVSLADPLEVTR